MLWLIGFLIFFIIVLLVWASKLRTLNERKAQALEISQRIGRAHVEPESSIDEFLVAQLDKPLIIAIYNKFKQAGMGDVPTIVRFVLAQVFLFTLSSLVLLFNHEQLANNQVAALVIIAFLPAGYLIYKVQMRQKEMRQDFPKMLDTLVRYLQTGYGIDGAISTMVQEMKGPLGEELSEVSRQLKLGISMRQILREFQNRVNLEEAQYFVVTLIIQRETGGQLSLILEDLAKTMRRRERLKQKLKTLTAESRMTAMFVGGAPVVYIAYRYLFDHESLEFFLTDPTGLKMFYISLGLIATGSIIVRNMQKVKF